MMPWSKFFWRDWESDPALRLCSLEAQGLWMRMLCVMAQAHPIGYLKIADQPCSVEDVARAAGIDTAAATRLLAELEQRGVYSLTRHGVIYSRRMVRDAKNRKTNQKNGSKGGRVSVDKRKGIFKSLKPPLEPPLEPRSQKQEEKKEKTKPEVTTSAGATEPVQAPSLSPAERKRRWEIGMEAYIRKQFPDAVARPLLEAWMERQPRAVAEINKLSDERKAAR